MYISVTFKVVACLRSICSILPSDIQYNYVYLVYFVGWKQETV